MSIKDPHELADIIMNEINGIKTEEAKKEEDIKAKNPWVSEELVIGTGEKAFSDIFGWTPRHGDFAVSVFTEPDSPEPMDYVWPKEQTEDFVRSIQLGLKPRLIGDAGTGKTEMCRQVAAMTGRAFYRFNFNINTEKEELLGCVEADSDGTIYLESDLAKYIARPSLILFDEISRATGELQMVLQRFTESLELYMPDKREGDNVVKAHDGCRVCAADNTLGMGESDVYMTGQVMDPSSLNRWEVAIKLDYQKESVERALIKKWAPTIPKHEIANLAKFSKLAQKGFKGRNLSLPFSPRNLKAIALLAMRIKSIQYAIELNYSNTLEPTEKKTVDELVNTVWGSSTI
jgi:hypothetical protein